jgi:hypothetical protein
MFFVTPALGAVSVIINKKNLNGVSDTRIKQLFTLRKSQFEDGTTAKLYLPKNGESRALFLSKVLFYSESRLSKRYEKMLKSKKGLPPQELTEQQILLAVVNEPNAIGVVNSDLVNDQVTVLYTIE